MNCSPNRCSTFAGLLTLLIGILPWVQAQETAFDVGYYPYHHKLRARADLSHSKDVVAARFVLTSQGNTNELAAAVVPVVIRLPQAHIAR